MKCRNCGAPLRLELIDLGSAPLSNAYLTTVSLRRPEKWFPLRVLVCEQCWLVQAEAYSRAAEIFGEDYAYFSSFSSQWVEHAKSYCDIMIPELGLNESSLVVEIASNDGYLLTNFVERGIPCIGIEPTASTAAAARQKGVPTLERFFGDELARELVAAHGHADLVVANNVLAHVPDPHDFVSGIALLLKPEGVVTFEFPHLMNLIELRQFDTIYHEHFAYYSFTAVSDLLWRCGIVIRDVKELPTHGGSLRVIGERSKGNVAPPPASVQMLLDRERNANMLSAAYYQGFRNQAQSIKNAFIRFLLDASAEQKTVVGYGAAAKGNTLLNFAGVRDDLIRFVVDRNPAKQGKYLPGSRIPIVEENCLRRLRPDFIVIFPWNLEDEVREQLSYVREWGAKFVVAIPELRVF